MEVVKIKYKEGKEVAIPKADLDWFLEKGWELVKEKEVKQQKQK